MADDLDERVDLIEGDVRDAAAVDRALDGVNLRIGAAWPAAGWEETTGREDGAPHLWLTELPCAGPPTRDYAQVAALAAALDEPVQRVFWGALGDAHGRSDGLRRADGSPKLLHRLWEAGGPAAVRRFHLPVTARDAASGGSLGAPAAAGPPPDAAEQGVRLLLEWLQVNLPQTAAEAPLAMKEVSS
ncbi:MAG: hypothetical protein R6X25_07650 [Candidatus Krumholzibacteriia bacterium]